MRIRTLIRSDRSVIFKFEYEFKVNISCEFARSVWKNGSRSTTSGWLVDVAVAVAVDATELVQQL